MSRAWPFTDPKNLATFTQRVVMSGERPVLYVSHDVSDGCWQFLTGDDVSHERPQLVCLSDVVATDPTLADLADLPLGWFAERDSVSAPWARAPKFPTEWKELVARAYEHTRDCQQRLRDEFRLDQWERYDYDQEKATLSFSDQGVPGPVARIEVVGSTATSSGTWLWSWDNPSVHENAGGSIWLIQKYGEQHGFEQLANAKWAADEIDAWEMTSVACLLMSADGAYRAPLENGALFLILFEPELVALGS